MDINYRYKLILTDDWVFFQIHQNNEEQKEACYLKLSPQEFKVQPPVLAVMIQEMLKSMLPKGVKIEIEDARS